jgi:hypothetical protein
MLQSIDGRRQRIQRKEGRAIRSFSRLLVARQFPNHFSTVQTSPLLLADPCHLAPTPLLPSASRRETSWMLSDFVWVDFKHHI